MRLICFIYLWRDKKNHIYTQDKVWRSSYNISSRRWKERPTHYGLADFKVGHTSHFKSFFSLTITPYLKFMLLMSFQTPTFRHWRMLVGQDILSCPGKVQRTLLKAKFPPLTAAPTPQREVTSGMWVAATREGEVREEKEAGQSVWINAAHFR